MESTPSLYQILAFQKSWWSLYSFNASAGPWAPKNCALSDIAIYGNVFGFGGSLGCFGRFGVFWCVWGVSLDRTTVILKVKFASLARPIGSPTDFMNSLLCAVGQPTIFATWL